MKHSTLRASLYAVSINSHIRKMLVVFLTVLVCARVRVCVQSENILNVIQLAQGGDPPE